MKLIQVEHAVDMIRAHLMGCALQDDWTDDRLAEVTDLIRGYVERIAAAPLASRPAIDRRLPRETLRQVVRFVNENLDSKLGDCDVNDDVGAPSDLGHRLCRRPDVAAGALDRRDVGTLRAPEAQSPQEDKQ